MFRLLFGEWLMRRLMRSSGRRRPQHRYGYRPTPRRGYYGWRAPRRRSRVHVTGCCLPLPLGVLIAVAGAARMAFHRR